MSDEIILSSDLPKLTGGFGQFARSVTELMEIEIAQVAHGLTDSAKFAVKFADIAVGGAKKVKVPSVGKVVSGYFQSLEKRKPGTLAKAMALSNPARLKPPVAIRPMNLAAEFGDRKYFLEKAAIPKDFAFINEAWTKKLVSDFHERVGGIFIPGGTITVPPAAPKNKTLTFMLKKVKCVDETNPEWVGDDEISAGAILVNDKGVETKVNQFMVKDDFDDGEVKNYDPPKAFPAFALDSDYSDPKAFSVWFALAEKDSGGFADFLSDLYAAIKAEILGILSALGAAAGASIGAAIGGSVGTAVGGPIGTIIGAVAGAVLGALVDWICGALSDDVFTPQLASIFLPSASATFANGSLSSDFYSLNFSGFGGQYRVTYFWKLTR